MFVFIFCICLYNCQFLDLSESIVGTVVGIKSIGLTKRLPYITIHHIIIVFIFKHCTPV